MGKEFSENLKISENCMMADYFNTTIFFVAVNSSVLMV